MNLGRFKTGRNRNRSGPVRPVTAVTGPVPAGLVNPGRDTGAVYGSHRSETQMRCSWLSWTGAHYTFSSWNCQLIIHACIYMWMDKCCTRYFPLRVLFLNKKHSITDTKALGNSCFFTSKKNTTHVLRPCLVSLPKFFGNGILSFRI